jgi:hypothetical protein
MIRTASKTKLPKTLSYPLGAAAISEALAEARHVNELSLRFYGQPVWPASEFQRILKDGLPYRILNVWYLPPTRPGYSGPNTLVESGWYGGRCALSVYPVRRELRSLAGEALRRRGLPAVVEWLKSSDVAGWESRQHELDLVFSPQDGALVTECRDGV